MARHKVQRGSSIAAARHYPNDVRLNALTFGTQVLTLDGSLPVEYLCPGDRVITRDSGTARLHAVRSHHLCLPAVSIAPGTLGHMRPDHEVMLPATQEVLLRDWRAKALFGAERALVPVVRIVDGTFIRALGEVEVELFELLFDAPHILYADGLEVAGAVLTKVPN